MATLFNTKIKDTYQSLLKLEDNTILTTTTKNVTDGLGNASPLYMSTTQVRIGSTSGSAMYWDNVNNRLGIGTSTPTSILHVKGVGTTSTTTSLLTQSSTGTTTFSVGDDGNILVGASTITFGSNIYFNRITSNFGGVTYDNDGVGSVRASYTNGRYSTNDRVGFGAYNNALSRVLIVGTGSSSATTSFLVQNSLGTNALQVTDDGNTFFYTASGATVRIGDSTTSIFRIINTYERINIQPISIGGSITLNAGTEAGASYTLNDNGHAFAYPFNRTTANTFTINRQFYGNVVSGTKTMLNIATSNISGLSNATLLRGIYFAPTITDWASVVAFESTAGNVIINGGNVGIGTSNPTSRLTVSGGDLAVSGNITSGGGNISISSNNSIVGYVASNQGMYLTGGAGEFRFINGSGSGWYYTWYQNGGEGMRLSTANNLLIGTTTDSGYKLDVNGSTRVKGNSLTLSASGLSSPPANYVALNFDDSPNHHEYWYAINSKKDLYGAIGVGYDRIIFPTMGNDSSTWEFNALGSYSRIQVSARNNTAGNYLNLTNSSIVFCGPWTVASIDRTNRKLVFGNMTTDVHHIAVYDILIKGAQPFESNTGGSIANGGNVYVVGGTPSTSPAGNYGNVLLAHDGTSARGNVGVGEASPTARLQVKGSGNSSATTSLLVQNSGGTEAFRIYDDRTAYFSSQVQIQSTIFADSGQIFRNSGNLALQSVAGVGNNKSVVINASPNITEADVAILVCNSTTKGFLPPRMTNAQRAAITSPAIGLMVYCTDAVEGIYVYKSTGWTFVA